MNNSTIEKWSNVKVLQHCNNKNQKTAVMSVMELKEMTLQFLNILTWSFLTARVFDSSRFST